MLRYFHRTLPARLALLVLAFVGWRLAATLLAPAPLTLTELRLQLVGERLGAGATLYRDLYTTLAPLTARLAWLLDAGLTGGADRSIWLYRLAAAVLLLTQALYFNELLNRREAVPAGRGWVPALLYSLAGSAWLELDTVTPLLVGQTLLLPAFGSLFILPTRGASAVGSYDNRNLFQAGFLLGLAALCHSPLLLFLPVMGLAVGFFTPNAFRSFLLLVCGLLFPYSALCTLYLYTGTLSAFQAQHLNWATLLPFSAHAVVPVNVLFVVGAVPGALLLTALGRAVTEGGSQLNFQVRFRQVMLAWAAGAVLLVAADQQLTPAALLAWLPPLAYFGPALLGRGPRGWVNELVFLVAVTGLAVTRFAEPLGLSAWLPVNPPALLATEPPGAPDPARGLRGQTLLYLGPDPRAYRRNHPATPYLEWELARRDFDHLTTYAALYRIRQAVSPARPQWLLDPANRYVPGLRYRLPDTFGAYRQVQPGVWRL